MLRLLSLIALCAGSVCVSASSAGSAAGLARDYGVKLCGREFIRAVIFTCGGSRWRRAGDEDAALRGADDDPFLTGSYSGPADKGDELGWARSSASEGPSKSAASLTDLLKALGDSNGPESGGSSEFGEREQAPGWQRGLLEMFGNLNAPWPRPNRQKRNFSLGLAGMCCNQGCTKNDIGRLC
uniref:Insulin-like domain-containing protein n=1 Tax=Scleropages formosus TaxID=113540 RepID=A0A8C9SN04_SCLFO